jgi:hypothetical protein
LLTKEPQMERSRSAPFTSMHPITTGVHQTSGSSSTSSSIKCAISSPISSSSNNSLGANQRHLTPSAARQAAALNNPLVQGYHLLAEPNRIHETSI